MAQQYLAAYELYFNFCMVDVYEFYVLFFRQMFEVNSVVSVKMATFTWVKRMHKDACLVGARV